MTAVLATIGLALLIPLVMFAALAVVAAGAAILAVVAGLLVVRLVSNGWRRLTGRSPFIARTDVDDGRRNVRVISRDDGRVS